LPAYQPVYLVYDLAANRFSTEGHTGDGYGDDQDWSQGK
jgi:hypothetical protein